MAMTCMQTEARSIIFAIEIRRNQNKYMNIIFVPYKIADSNANLLVQMIMLYSGPLVSPKPRAIVRSCE